MWCFNHLSPTAETSREIVAPIIVAAARRRPRHVAVR